MKELELAIVAAFNTMAENGTIQKIVEEKIKKTVDSILDDALRSYSDFGKELSKTIREGLNVDMRQLGLVGYNDIVLKIIKEKLDNSIEVVGRARIEKEMEELLATPPAEIKLSQLVEQLKKGDLSDDKYKCTCIVDWGNNDGWGRVYLDESERDKRACAHQLAFTADGEIYSISIDGRDPNKKLFIGPFYNFERSLFQMYVAKTRLIVDEDQVNTYYPGRD